MCPHHRGDRRSVLSSPSIYDYLLILAGISGGLLDLRSASASLEVDERRVEDALHSLSRLGYGVSVLDDEARIVGDADLEQPYPWRVRRYLRAELIGNSIIYAREVRSTQELALEMGVNGAVIIAGLQTEGRGRWGRRWISTKDDLKMSIVTPIPPSIALKAELLQLAGGLAARNALAKLGIFAYIKWPNDVMYGTRKIAGVLTNLNLRAHLAVLGFGVNVNSRASSIIGVNAISMAEILKGRVDMALVAAEIINELDSILHMRSADLLMKKVKGHMPMLGSEVCVVLKDGGSACGTAEDISGDGTLMLRMKNGLRSISDYEEVRVDCSVNEFGSLQMDDE